MTAPSFAVCVDRRSRFIESAVKCVACGLHTAEIFEMKINKRRATLSAHGAVISTAVYVSTRESVAINNQICWCYFAKQ